LSYGPPLPYLTHSAKGVVQSRFTAKSADARKLPLPWSRSPTAASRY